MAISIVFYRCFSEYTPILFNKKGVNGAGPALNGAGPALGITYLGYKIA